jgi:hypothetical protein
MKSSHVMSQSCIFTFNSGHVSEAAAFHLEYIRGGKRFCQQSGRLSNKTRIDFPSICDTEITFPLVNDIP